MFTSLVRMVVRLFGTTMRTLWSGTSSAKFGAFIGIVVVTVLFTTVAGPALAQLMTVLLIIGGLLAIFAVVIRG